MTVILSLGKSVRMLEDTVLIWRFKRGSREALCRIYEKYRTDLLRLAAMLLRDKGDAEDAVHDAFVSFARSAETLKLSGSLKGYLLTCVANNARNRNRARQRKQTVGLAEAAPLVTRWAPAAMARSRRRPDRAPSRTAAATKSS